MDMITTNNEYSQDCIQFAEDVAHMMACRKKVEEIKRAQRIAPMHRKYNNDDYEEACYELRKAEEDVKEWLNDIFGEG
jgi:hypothetical protein